MLSASEANEHIISKPYMRVLADIFTRSSFSSDRV